MTKKTKDIRERDFQQQYKERQKTQQLRYGKAKDKIEKDKNKFGKKLKEIRNWGIHKKEKKQQQLRWREEKT